MAVVPFPARNNLAYPARRLVGFNPSHPAAQNCGVSGVAAYGGIFRDTLTGKVGSNATGPSTSTTSLYGNLGPVTNCVAAADNTAFPFVNSTSALTLASIFKVNALTAVSQYILATAAATTHNGIGVSLLNSGVFSVVINGTTGIDLGPSASFDVPYFLAASFNGALVNYVIVRLDTGNLVASGQIANAAAIGVGDGSIWIGNRGANSRNLNGGIAAAVASNVFLSEQLLLQWADDPWAFWYPPQARSLVAAAAAAPTTVLYSLMNVG